MAGVAPSAGEEWKRHWTLVLAAGLGFSFMSFMSPATGLFMAPLQQAFGWDRALLSSGMAIGAALALLLSPFFGSLVDRFGSRRLALPGIAATAASIAAFSTLDGATWQWFALWFVFGICSLTIGATTWTTVVAGVFGSGRGLALGLTLSGSALALAIVPPLANWLIGSYGWRSAFIYLGLTWGGVALLLCALFLVDRRDGNHASVRGAKRAPANNPETEGLSIADAWRDKALWRVAAATLVTLIFTVGVQVHQVPIMVDVGMTRSDAAWLASLAGIGGIIGKLVTGSLVDRFHVRWVGGLTLASTAVAYPLLIEPLRTPGLIVVGMMINGYAAGTKLQLCGYLTAKYAGLRNFGKIFGFMSSLVALAGGAGPILAGFVFDRAGSYTPFLIAGAFGSLLSGLLVFSLGPYPGWGSSDRRTEPASAPEAA